MKHRLSLVVQKLVWPLHILSPVLIDAICVPPTVNCLQYLATGSTLTAVWPFQLPAPQSGTLSRISSGTRPPVRTVSDGCLKRICSLDTSAFSELEVLTITALYKFTYLLTYLLTYYFDVSADPVVGGTGVYVRNCYSCVIPKNTSEKNSTEINRVENIWT